MDYRDSCHKQPHIALASVTYIWYQNGAKVSYGARSDTRKTPLHPVPGGGGTAGGAPAATALAIEPAPATPAPLARAAQGAAPTEAIMLFSITYIS